MNNPLKKEIINHIFNKFGLLTRESVVSSEGSRMPLSNKFLLDQKLIFEVDDEKYENNIWSAEAKIEDARIQFIIADLTEEIPEYSLLIQLDDFPPFAARISLDPEDIGSLLFRIEEIWVEASILYQAKILVAIESIMELFITWDKNSSSENIYKDLIAFLKFESDNDE